MPKRKRRSTQPKSQEPGLRQLQRKRTRTVGNPIEGNQDTHEAIGHPTLSLYFLSLSTLREYLAELLNGEKPNSRGLRNLNAVTSEDDSELSLLLDTTLVGASERPSSSSEIHRGIEAAKTQAKSPTIEQKEIVELVQQIIWHRFSTAPKQPRNDYYYYDRPPNMLTSGTSISYANDTVRGALGILLQLEYPNEYVNHVKGPLWQKLLRVVGEQAMLKVLLDTSIFIRIGDEFKKIYKQISGPKVSNAAVVPGVAAVPPVQSNEISTAGHRHMNGLKHSLPGIEPNAKNSATQQKSSATTEKTSFAEIIFVRQRMFYSKPVKNGRGEVRFGLRDIHALNRYRFSDEDARGLIKYIFPREFGLHNVFTSEVDRSETAMRFKDYTVRDGELEILKMKSFNGRVSIPKRLRGTPLSLTLKLIKRHRNCSYHALLKHYCPQSLCDPNVPDKRVGLSADAVPMGYSSPLSTQALTASSAVPLSSHTSLSEASPKETFADFACTSGEVSAFVKAVVAHVIPYDLFGSGDLNRMRIGRSIDMFIKLRKFEHMSLHDVIQGLKLTDMGWLRPPSIEKDCCLSKPDAEKRRQLFAEFIYWLFDSFIIPLINSNFYVTDTSTEGNRMMYFRHDVWRKLTEPALNELRTNMFNRIKSGDAEKILQERKVGATATRLVPKEKGVRMIMNLGKRGTKIDDFGRTRLTSSSNKVVEPAFHALKYEISQAPEKLGSSILSVSEMYPRLKAFRAHLIAKGWQHRKLYFVKVDVQTCYDSIPQKKLIPLVKDLLSEEEYQIHKHAEIRPPAGTKWPIKRFISRSWPADEISWFSGYVEERQEKLKRGTVLVDDVVPVMRMDRRKLVEMVRTHFEDNIVQIDKKYYRQKTGIPQGSRLSTILCSLLYGKLEHENFSLDPEVSLLLRMVDDSLFITLEREKAEKFLQIMHDGIPEYGVRINAGKSLVNFETTINGRKINRLVGTLEFPYCGSTIHTKTLDIRKDLDKRQVKSFANNVTVSFRKPGAMLIARTLKFFSYSAQPMLFDTGHNRFRTVVQNIYYRFVETAMKFHRYIKSVQRNSRLTTKNLQVAFSELLNGAYVIMSSQQKNWKFVCSVTRAQLRWLGAHAFRKVLAKKQSGYKEFLKWVDGIEEAAKEGGGRISVGGVSGLSLEPFQCFRY